MHFGIIAAGEGSRLADEGEKTCKPLLPLDGEPMIGRLLKIFANCDAESVGIVVNGDMPQVKAYLDEIGPQMPMKINIVIKNTPSSMHTFSELVTLMPENGKFVVTTVDTVFAEETFRNYVGTWENASEDIDGLMGVSDFIEDEKPLYVSVDGEMEITGFHDTAVPGCKYVSGGIYGLGTRAREVLQKCMVEGVNRMRNYQRALIESGLRLKAFPMGKIIDVDHVSDIAIAEKFLKEERWLK